MGMSMKILETLVTMQRIKMMEQMKELVFGIPWRTQFNFIQNQDLVQLMDYKFLILFLK